MHEPQLCAWVQHPVAPAAQFDIRPGHWVSVADWTGRTKMIEALK